MVTAKISIGMLLRPLLVAKTCPLLNQPGTNIRNIRPSMKISSEKFQLTLDVRDYKKDEMRVKVHPESVTIEGKQERKTKQGCMMRRFTRKFRLPEGCVTNTVESRLSPDGVLTITGQRNPCDKACPCESYVPIRYAGPADDDVPMVPPSDKKPAPTDVQPKEKKPKPSGS